MLFLFRSKNFKILCFVSFSVDCINNCRMNRMTTTRNIIKVYVENVLFCSYRILIMNKVKSVAALLTWVIYYNRHLIAKLNHTTSTKTRSKEYVKRSCFRRAILYWWYIQIYKLQNTKVILNSGIQKSKVLGSNTKVAAYKQIGLID